MAVDKGGIALIRAISRRCSHLHLIFFYILCTTIGGTTMFFPMGKKIDLRKITTPMLFSKKKIILSYKKPTPYGGWGVLSILGFGKTLPRN